MKHTKNKTRENKNTLEKRESQRRKTNKNKKKRYITKKKRCCTYLRIRGIYRKVTQLLCEKIFLGSERASKQGVKANVF